MNTLTLIAEAAPSISARSGEIEKLRRLPDDILDWIYELKLFKLFVPPTLGGRTTSLPEALHIFEALAAIDGSLGWLVHIGAAGGYFVPSFDQNVASQLFSDRRAVVAGTGYPAGEAKKVDDGYVVNGRWKYASGARHATLFTASAVIVGNEAEGIDEEEAIRAFAFDPAQVSVEEDWRAFGLKATSSDTFVVENAFVPDARSFVVGTHRWALADPMYRVPFLTIAETTIAAVCIGLARRFFELVGAIPRFCDMPDFRQMDEKANHLRAMFHTVAHNVWSEMVHEGELTRASEETVGATAKHVAHELRNMVQALFPKLGMQVLWESECLNRVYRDLETACHHTFLNT